MITTERSKAYRLVYINLLESHGIDLIDANFYHLTAKQREVVVAAHLETHRKIPLTNFLRYVRSQAIANSWRDQVANIISSSFDFSEYKWPIYHKSSVDVYLGLSRDVKVGKAFISIKNRTVKVSAHISAEVIAEHKEYFNRSEMGVGFYEAAGPAIQITDIYFN